MKLFLNDRVDVIVTLLYSLWLVLRYTNTVTTIDYAFHTNGRKYLLWSFTTIPKFCALFRDNTTYRTIILLLRCVHVMKLQSSWNLLRYNDKWIYDMQVNGTPQCRQPATADVTKSANNRGKRKARWKLKFHHQALPPEYLDHYEASLQQNKDSKSPSCSTTQSTTPSPSIVKSSPKPSTSAKPPSASPSHQSIQSTVRYKDLPYMGEMTLDNARPRRGRKPKKADICHLIYKNYGTTVVDEPLNLCLRDLQSKETPNDVSMRKFKFTGGATPSLQERKSASLDSTGNLRLLTNSRARSKELKRKSRKSLAREKLEKTFKEKGFLIQTQQLESAQGATYCKFRQLRKFTRYLFRSWKHHLPGDIVNNNNV